MAYRNLLYFDSGILGLAASRQIQWRALSVSPVSPDGRRSRDIIHLLPVHQLKSGAFPLTLLQRVLYEPHLLLRAFLILRLRQSKEQARRCRNDPRVYRPANVQEKPGAGVTGTSPRVVSRAVSHLTEICRMDYDDNHT